MDTEVLEHLLAGLLLALSDLSLLTRRRRPTVLTTRVLADHESELQPSELLRSVLGDVYERQPALGVEPGVEGGAEFDGAQV